MSGFVTECIISHYHTFSFNPHQAQCDVWTFSSFPYQLEEFAFNFRKFWKKKIHLIAHLTLLQSGERHAPFSKISNERQVSYYKAFFGQGNLRLFRVSASHGLYCCQAFIYGGKKTQKYSKPKGQLPSDYLICCIIKINKKVLGCLTCYHVAPGKFIEIPRHLWVIVCNIYL